VAASPLDPTRPLEAEVRRILDERLADAEARLRLPGAGGLDKAVHESRKRIKEARALLRLLRKTLVTPENEPIRPWANEVLATAARPLGPAREAAVAMETLTSLKLNDAEFLENELISRHATVLAGETPDLATDAATKVAIVRSRAQHWLLTSPDFRSIRPGLVRTYTRGLDAMERALASRGDIEAWHDWRKRAKDLRYSLEFLQLSSPLVAAMVPLAKELTTLLGRDHDLAELVDGLEAVDSPGKAALSDATGAERQEIQAKAQRVGAELYAERPAGFGRRLRVYWENASAATS
jgi:CHAD domain-containing protein